MNNHAVPNLQTERLLLRPLALADAPQIQQIFPQWEILRYMNGTIPWPYPPDGAETFLREAALPQMEQGECWHWSIRPKEQRERLIGVISLQQLEDNHRGFWLDPAWQRRGLMTEAATEVMRFWFEDLAMPVMRVPKAAGNLASRRISEKEGMRMVAHAEKDFVSGRLPVDIWEITAAEWRANRT